MKILFSLDTPVSATGDYVVRSGKAFQLGNYLDKSFSLEEDESDNAIAAFSPVPLNIEHMPTVLDGKLGFLSKLWRDGKELLAEFSIPKWLNEVLGTDPIKVSCEWDTYSFGKRLSGCAIVLNPRVRDAAFSAAFSMQHDDDMAQMQDVKATFAVADLSFSQRRSILNSALYSKMQEASEYCYVCVQDVYDGFLTYMDYDSDGLFRVTYKIGNDYAVAFGDPEAVISTTHYEPAPANPVKGKKTTKASVEASPDKEKRMPFSLREFASTLLPFLREAGVEVDEAEVKSFSKEGEQPAPETAAESVPTGTVVDVKETAEFKAQSLELEALKAEKAARLEVETAQFKVANDAAIEKLVTAFKIDPAQRETEAAIRAKNPEVYDQIAERLPAKFSGSNTPTSGTITGEDALKLAGADAVALATFTNTAAAVADVTGPVL